MSSIRDTRVKRQDATDVDRSQVICVEFDLNWNNTNVWQLTEAEAQQLADQLLAVAGSRDAALQRLRRVSADRLRELEQIKLERDLARAEADSLRVEEGRCGSCSQEVFEQ